jgi:hypothetical protein
MIIVDPITLGDTSFSRPSAKWVYDRTGTLVEVPANTLGVTYDPADLSKAPWALLESAATNIALQSETFDDSRWGKDGVTVTGNAITAPNGTLTADKLIENSSNSGHYVDQTIAINAGVQYTRSVFVKAGERTQVRLEMYSVPTVAARANVSFDLVTGAFFGETSSTGVVQNYSAQRLPNGWWRLTQIFNLGTSDASCFFRVCLVGPASTTVYQGDGASGAFVWGAMLGAGSYVPTTTAPVTRAADVVGSVAGLLYSNVPITEPDYSAAATYAKDALVHDPATHNVFKSLIDANKGKALTDPAAWNPRGATNRWAMLDQYNNTQTAYPEEILIVLTPQAISEGLYIGNCEADEIELSVVDQSEGLVASEVMSLVTASGTSSYFDWCFRPADRSDYFVSTSLPPYANALVLVAIRKPGGMPKCGMLAIGGVDDFGPSLYGLSAEGKDYSSTTFNFDGTTNTELRPYAKRMSVDVQVDNGEIDYIQRKLFQIRQRPVVWIGGPYGATAVFGRYGSFKIVIPGLKKSDMALQIEGSV